MTAKKDLKINQKKFARNKKVIYLCTPQKSDKKFEITAKKDLKINQKKFARNKKDYYFCTRFERGEK
ncbi:hypothetical protein B0A58_09280 [Flavobacterium branchiophilum NBRC 15030 = ATCC 35035]|nr:hypothetical protein B0A58_09280 [Flavobacterium branchiophilum NBRC 15030 = ATCC 35035]